jgi:hypothetical protein
MRTLPTFAAAAPTSAFLIAINELRSASFVVRTSKTASFFSGSLSSVIATSRSNAKLSLLQKSKTLSRDA